MQQADQAAAVQIEHALMVLRRGLHEFADDPQPRIANQYADVQAIYGLGKGRWHIRSGQIQNQGLHLHAVAVAYQLGIAL